MAADRVEQLRNETKDRYLKEPHLIGYDWAAHFIPGLCGSIAKLSQISILADAGQRRLDAPVASTG